MQLSQNSEPHLSQETNCPGRYPVKQLSQLVPFIMPLEKYNLKTIREV